MSPNPTIAQVRQTLVRVFDRLDACFDRPAAALKARPAYPGAWSIAEHLEHVTLANHFLLLTIAKGCRKALRRAALGELPVGESDLERLAPIADPDAFPWSPPDHMVPTGGREAGELRALLRSQGRQCLELLDALPLGAGRLCTIAMSVHELGRLDLYQWLYFLAQHGRYHLELIGRRRG